MTTPQPGALRAWTTSIRARGGLVGTWEGSAPLSPPHEKSSKGRKIRLAQGLHEVNRVSWRGACALRSIGERPSLHSPPRSGAPVARDQREGFPATCPQSPWGAPGLAVPRNALSCRGGLSLTMKRRMSSDLRVAPLVPRGHWIGELDEARHEPKLQPERHRSRRGRASHHVVQKRWPLPRAVDRRCRSAST